MSQYQTLTGKLTVIMVTLSMVIMGLGCSKSKTDKSKTEKSKVAATVSTVQASTPVVPKGSFKPSTTNTAAMSTAAKTDATTTATVTPSTPTPTPTPTLPPVVSLGDDLIITASTTLHATVTSSDSQLSYAWSVLSGPDGVTFGTPDAVDTNFTATTDGTYVVSCIVTDSSNNSVSSKLGIIWDSTAPAIDVGGDISLPTNVITKTATVVDNLSATPTLNWSKQSGPGNVTFSAFNAATTDITVDANGAYVIRLAATDTAGNSAYREFTFTRKPDGAVISAGANITTNHLATLTGTVDDASGVTYVWSAQSGPGTVTLGTPTALSTTATASAEGIYNMRLTATKNGFQTFSDMTLIWDTTPPVVHLSDMVVTEASTIYANVSDNLTAMTHQWAMFKGPGVCTFGSPKAATSTISCDTDGSYILRLTSTDAANNAFSASMHLVWDHNPPTVNIGSDIIGASTPVTLSASVSDATAYTLLWSKDSGPGNVSISNTAILNPVVSFDSDGTYVLRLTATDASSHSSFATINIEWIPFTKVFDFTNLSAYSYSPAEIAISATKVASLAPIPTYPAINSSAAFNAAGATLSNIAWDAGASGLVLNAAGLTARSGTYQSPVLDFGTTMDVRELAWNNPVPGPYQRNLPGNGQADPLSWGSDRIDTMNGLVMLFHFDEDAGSTQLVDSSLNLTSSGTPMVATCNDGNDECALLNYRGRIGRGAEFNGSGEYYTIPDDPANQVTGSITIMAWINVNNGWFNYIIEKGYADTCDNYAFFMYGWQAGFEFSKDRGENPTTGCNGTWDGWFETAPAGVTVGQWYHMAVVFDQDAGSVTFYRNGVISNTITGITDELLPSNRPVTIARQQWGDNIPNAGFFDGGLDELAVFKRPLSQSEIQKVYRRGLYRFDMQVRGCTDATCSTNPAWLGPDGTSTTNFYTYFKTDDTQINDLPVIGVNSVRYFQYKALFTAPDAVTTPVFKSIAMSTFPTDNPTLMLTASTRRYDTIKGFSEVVESDHIGTVKYQISPNGTDWYYYDGTKWAATTGGFENSNLATEINAQVATIAGQVGTGTFYYKAFFNRNPGLGYIKLDGVKISGTLNSH